MNFHCQISSFGSSHRAWFIIFTNICVFTLVNIRKRVDVHVLAKSTLKQRSCLVFRRCLSSFLEAVGTRQRTSLPFHRRIRSNSKSRATVVTCENVRIETKISNSPDISEYAAAGLQTVAMKDSHHFHVTYSLLGNFDRSERLAIFMQNPSVGREKLDRMQNWPFARGQESLQRFSETRRRATGQRRLRLRFLVRRRRLTFRSAVVARVSVFYSGADIDPTATTWRCRPVITLCAVFLHVADEILCAPCLHTSHDVRSALENPHAQTSKRESAPHTWLQHGPRVDQTRSLDKLFGQCSGPSSIVIARWNETWIRYRFVKVLHRRVIHF